MRLIKNYKVIVLADINMNETFTISFETTHWKPLRGGGWHVIVEIPYFDGKNDDVITIYEINEECLIYIIYQAKEPSLLNVKMVKNSDGDAMTLTSDDIYKDIISSINE